MAGSVAEVRAGKRAGVVFAHGSRLTRAHVGAQACRDAEGSGPAAGLSWKAVAISRYGLAGARKEEKGASARERDSGGGERRRLVIGGE